MKNICSTLVFSLFLVSMAYGKNSNNLPTLLINKCSDNLTQYCLYGYMEDLSQGIKLASYSPNLKGQFVRNMEMAMPNKDIAVLNRVIAKKMIQVVKQNDHLEAVMGEVKGGYLLHKTSVFGQLTNTINIQTNHHQMNFRKMEGFGLRFRF